MQHATLSLDTHFSAGIIDRRIFGGFLEHMGRAVYEGIFDPGNPLSNADGYRLDTIEALRPLGMPLIRYPGGNFVSNYDWTDGIGPRELRPRRRDFAWNSIETNQFGTDEFMKWLGEVGAKPMLAVNLGTGTPASAAALVEYCNLPVGTKWADIRASNGHPEPYEASIWCLGNEMDGDWQAGHVPADVYAQRANQASRLMKGLDPRIETVICGSSGYGMESYLRWDETVLDFCWETADYLSAHRYSGNDRGDSAWFLAEGIIIDRILDDYMGLLNYMRGVKKSPKRFYLSFDEWNVWYKNTETNGHGSSAPHLIEEIYNLEDALIAAQYLNSFIRHADLVKVACIAQIANVIAPILTRPEGLLRQTIYYPFLLYSQAVQATAGRAIALTPSVTSPTYLAGDRGETPCLDAAASFDPETSQLSLFLVNRHLTDELHVDVALADAHINALKEIWMLKGDVKAMNTWENPEQIVPVAGSATLTEQGRLSITIPSPGLVVANVSFEMR
jgi:alpha-L-arabinofuranosidase